MTVHFNVVTGKLRHFWELVGESGNYHITRQGRIVPKSLLYPPVYGDFRTASLDLNFAKKRTLKDQVSGNNLITFTRASSGTYVDSDGLIKTSPINLLRYSEQFDQSAWVKVGSISANVELAPDGSQTADKASFVSTKWLIYDNNNSASVPGFPQDYPFTVTDKWKRQSTTFTTPSGCTSVRFYPLRSSNNSQWIYQTISGLTSNTTYTASAYYKLATDNVTVLAWGTQTEEGTTATDYIPTGATISGAPRFDHDPVTGESLGLLIEESRANLILHSQDFTDPFWRNVLDSSTVPSPDGEQNTYEITDSKGLFQDAVSSAPANVSIVSSIFAKFAGAGNPSGVQARVGGIGSNAAWVNYDLVNGTIGNTSATSGTSVKGKNWTLDGYGIEPFANGWYRIYIVYTVNAATKLSWKPSEAPATDTESPSSTGEVLVFGCQIEEGTFPTSYISTTSSAVTRSPDIATIEGTNFSSWYNQSEGTWFGEVKKAYPATKRLMEVGDSSTNQASVSIRPSTTSTFFARNASGASSVNHTYPAKFACADSVTDIRGCVNGTLAALITTGSSPADDKLVIGGVVSTTSSTNAIARLAYFPTRLPDDKLESITT